MKTRETNPTLYGYNQTLMCPPRSDSDADRAVSPVVGTALFLAIVLVLVAVSSAFVFGLTETQDPAPQAKLALEPIQSSDDYRLVHESGDPIEGRRVVIRGIDDPDTLAGTTLNAGDEIRVTPTSQRVKLIWEEQQQEPSSYILSTFEATLSSSSSPPSSSVSLPDGVVFTGRSNGILNVSGDGGSTSLITTNADPAALGPASDIDADGTVEVPYVDGSGNVRLVTDDGSERLLVDSSTLGSVETSKTRLAVGTWDGSAQSVFFAYDSNKIYRAAPGGSPVEVATLGNSVDGVIGPADIDGDSSDELVFIDGSQTIRYLEADGTTETTDGITAGSSTGVGGGSVADYDGDGAQEVAIVNGGNDIYVADASGSDKVESSDVDGSSAPSARQSPPTAADVDGDDSPELAYLGNDDGKLKYLDNIDGPGDIEIEFLTDAAGDKIDGNDATGVT